MLRIETRTEEYVPESDRPKEPVDQDLKKFAKDLIGLDEGKSYIESWMFRVTGEYVALFISVVLLLISGYILSILNPYLLVATVIVGLVFVRLTQAQYLGSAVRVHKSQFPKIFSIFERNAKRLGISKANLYIKQDPNPNAYTIGITTGTIILTSSLVDSFTNEEINFVLGHELGHFKAGHTVLSTLVTPLGSNNIFSRLIFGFWQRKTEYSADRCGLILTKKMDPAISTLLKLTVGPTLYKNMDVKGYISQIEKANNKSVRASEILVDHPFTTNRIKNLIIFWDKNFLVIK